MLIHFSSFLRELPQASSIEVQNLIQQKTLKQKIKYLTYFKGLATFGNKPHWAIVLCCPLGSQNLNWKRKTKLILDLVVVKWCHHENRLLGNAMVVSNSSWQKVCHLLLNVGREAKWLHDLTRLHKMKAYSERIFKKARYLTVAAEVNHKLN